MLDELRVSNLGVIADAQLELSLGLIAVTGETGAGKTALLGALELLRGDPARTARIGPASGEARVEGRFVTGERDVVAARRVSSSRSRAYLDGQMVTNRRLAEELGDHVELVAQHEHLSLRSADTIRRLLDGRLDASGREAHSGYREAWTTCRELLAERDAVGGDPRALVREAELAHHQASEIAAAGLNAGEDDELRARIRRLEHGEEIAVALHGIGERLTEADLGRAVDDARRATALDPTLTDLRERVEGIVAESDELAREARSLADRLDLDPASLQAAQDRLSVIYDLRRKYGDSVEEVLAFGADAARRHEQATTALARADQLEAELACARSGVESHGKSLADARRRAGKELAAATTSHLRDLGFEDPVVRFEVTQAQPGPAGTDRVGLEFSSHPAVEPGPLGAVASGGELSRLVLATWLAARHRQAPVVGFDEIDAGIGGATALAMGRKLQQLATGRQVLVVTHLAQVAAHADLHLVAERVAGTATIRPVTGPDRVAELARMLGGEPGSGAARGAADELLDTARRHPSRD